MAALVEYLLCGLPVVSTASVGGRDVFFDDEYVKIVEDTPDAVRAGVAEIIRRRVSPELIRARTLERMQAHRERFVKLVQGMYDAEKNGRRFEAEWPDVLGRGVIKPRDLNRIGAYL
jgi:glycosyltransferase involved in cell wall biosynthesis